MMRGNDLSPKVISLYEAIMALFWEGADMSCITVAEIAARAGIGKGTVYEYFSNKEEMIAGALYYCMEELCEKLRQKICQEEHLYDKMMQILMTMEEQVQEANSFLHLLHMKESSSEIGRRMKVLIEEKKDDRNFITHVLQEMLARAVSPRLAADREVMSYLTMTVFSKIISFVMMIGECMIWSEVNSDHIKQMICRSICNEVAYCEESKAWESAIS